MYASKGNKELQCINPFDEDQMNQIRYLSDGIIYYAEDTQNGYLLNITHDGWVQVISAPITDISLVPEEEKDKVPVAVGGLIDAINETKNYVDEKISSSSAGSIDGGEI